MCQVADPLPQAPPLAKGVEAHDLEAARRGTGCGREDAQQRGFSRSVLAQHGHVLAGVDGEVDGFHGHLRAEPMGETVRHQNAHLLSSVGVLISGQSTNGPAANRSSVATMRAI